MSSSARSLRFAPLRREDVEAVMEVERRCFESPWTPGQFRHEIKVPFSRTVVAWDDEGPGRVAGYVCRWAVGGEVSILNLAVDLPYRRSGLGRTLVDLVLNEAMASGVREVTLEVRENNDAARELYASMGFIRTGLRKNYYAKGDHALIMTRTLSPADPPSEGLCPNSDTGL